MGEPAFAGGGVDAEAQGRRAVVGRRRLDRPEAQGLRRGDLEVLAAGRGQQLRLGLLVGAGQDEVRETGRGVEPKSTFSPASKLSCSFEAPAR